MSSKPVTESAKRKTVAAPVGASKRAKTDAEEAKKAAKKVEPKEQEIDLDDTSDEDEEDFDEEPTAEDLEFIDNDENDYGLNEEQAAEFQQILAAYRRGRAF